MFLARVEGSVVATKKDPSMSGRKLLLVRPQLVDDKDPTRFRAGANTIIAVDSVGAGLGELVMFCQGSSARLAPNLKDAPVDAVIIGIVDVVDVMGKQIYNVKTFLISLALQFAFEGILYCQSIQTTNFDGGPVITELSPTIKVNEHSSLHRTWYVFNDVSCPLQIQQMGIEVVYARGSASGFKFNRQGSAKITHDIAAMEIRHVLFDVFGEHMKTLYSVEIEDLTATDLFTFPAARWDAREDVVREYLTEVTFVSQVRTQDGKIWRYSEKAISKEFAQLQLKIADLALESERTK